MALEFRRRRFYRPGKKGQLALAVAALLLALCTAALWMLVNFHIDRAPSPEESQNESLPVMEDFSEKDSASMLIILGDKGTEQFILIQADPANSDLRAATVPSSLSVGKDKTLMEIYRKSGSAAAVTAVSETLALPIRHHIALSSEKAETWFNYLENGVNIPLEKAINITDANGRSVRLQAGEHTIIGEQAVCLLNNSGRSDALSKEFPAQLTAAMINQYLYKERHLSRDFTQIANLSKTSLRIGDFNDYRPILDYLSSVNKGCVCKVVSLYGETTNDRFVFDKKETAHHTALYE